MTSLPHVSIVLPVYNRKHLIMRAMDSVFSQTYTDWELLIVDDGSTDKIEELLIPLVLHSHKLRYMKHANRKLGLTRNIGIHASLGLYVTFLDSDDEFEPSHVQLRVQYMHDHPELDFIHGGFVLIGPEESHYVQDIDNPMKKIHLSECCIGSTFFGKKSSFIASGGFQDMQYSAESEFLRRVEKGFKVGKVDYPTYRYYTGLEDSICTTYTHGKEK
jgi:glycosyltransferase involved in cell wall biosynthesis